jgi:predicted PurR-regulated permease PerM
LKLLGRFFAKNTKNPLVNLVIRVMRMNQISNIKINKTKFLYYILTVFLVYMLYKYRITAASIFKPFIFSIVLAYLLNPIVELFEKRKIRRIFSVIIVYLIFLALILVFALVLVPRLIKDIKVLVINLPYYSIQFQNMFKSFQDTYINSNLPQGIKDVMDESIINLQDLLIVTLQSFLDSVVNSFSKILSIIIVPVIVFYLLKDAEYFKKQSLLLLPKKHRNKAILLFRDIDNAFGKYIRGQIIVATFIGVLTTTALSIIGVKYAVFLGLFAGIANIIPYFGPIIGLIPTVLFALFDSPAKALYAAIAFILTQQIESGILTPKIIGGSVGVHPVYVILSLFVGGKLMGIAGMVLAVPVLVAIKLTMRHLLRYVKHEV